MGVPAPGDEPLIDFLLRHRVLTSGQLSRLTGRSCPVIRRRLRRYLAGQLGLVTILDGGSAYEQQAYCLSRKGFEYVAQLEGRGVGTIPYSAKQPAGPGSLFYRHTRLTNDVWIEIERRMAEPGCLLQLERAIPEWEMTQEPRKRGRRAKHWEQFVISERFADIGQPGVFHRVRPDARFIIYPVGHPELRIVADLEADRATEASQGRVMNAKLLGYWHAFLRRSFEGYGACAMRVLFVLGNVRTERRIGSLQRAVLELARRNAERHRRFQMEALQALVRAWQEAHGGQEPTDLELARMRARLPGMDAFTGCFRFCLREDVMHANILTDPVWRTVRGQVVPFFRGERDAVSVSPSRGELLTRETA